MDDDEALALFGTTQQVPVARRLNAGSLSCELVSGQLRDVRWQNVEIVRGVSYLLRDADWGTVPSLVEDLVIQEEATSFDARFRLCMSTGDGRLVALAHLHGQSDGQLSFEVRAVAEAEIATNRCGMVVLHPAAAAGSLLRVEHTDGRESSSAFPLEISPSQPVFDIRALSYSPAEGMDLQLRLEAELPGDPAGKFEMEDQRNWSDASFKTYVASLLDPWPYVLPASKELTQRVSLRVQGGAVSGAPPRDAPAVVMLGDASTVCMPAIGVGVPAGWSRARSEEFTALRGLGAAWWIVEADLREPALAADLSAVAECRSGLAVQIQLDVIAGETSSPVQAATLAADLCAGAGLTVDAVRLLPAAYLKSYQPRGHWPDLPPLQDFASAARRCFPQALVGGGMFTSFTELNRKRQPAQGLDFIGHLTCPIVHAADDVSVMQTTESLPHLVHSVRCHWPSLAYRLGPTSMAPRRNPYGQSTAANPQGTRLTLAVSDPRHDAQFGAAWTVAYAAAAAPWGLDLLALHDSHGPNGPLAWHARNSPEPAMVPLWSALGCLAKAAGGPLVPLLNLPGGVRGMAWTHDGTQVNGLVANVTTEPVVLRWATPVHVAGLAPANETRLSAYQVCEFEVAPGLGDH